jgi:hypothetical protein
MTIRTPQLHNTFRIASVCVILALTAGTCTASEYDEVVKNPQAFHHKRVSIVGIAEIQGDSFALYQRRRPQSSGELARTIFIARRIKGPMYTEFNHHRTKVTGIVDANAHGNGYYACEILVERIEAAK